MRHEIVRREFDGDPKKRLGHFRLFEFRQAKPHQLVNVGGILVPCKTPAQILKGFFVKFLSVGNRRPDQQRPRCRPFRRHALPQPFSSLLDPAGVNKLFDALIG